MIYTIHRKPQVRYQKTTRVINESGKAAGHKIYTQKSLAFLYTNNEEKLRKQSHLPSHQKKNPGINLFEEANNLYSEN